MSYGYAIIPSGTNEEDEQLTMAYDLDVLKDIAKMDIIQYPPAIFEDFLHFINEYVSESELREHERVGIDVYDEQGEYAFVLRFEKVW